MSPIDNSMQFFCLYEHWLSRSNQTPMKTYKSMRHTHMSISTCSYKGNDTINDWAHGKRVWTKTVNYTSQPCVASRYMASLTWPWIPNIHTDFVCSTATKETDTVFCLFSRGLECRKWIMDKMHLLCPLTRSNNIKSLTLPQWNVPLKKLKRKAKTITFMPGASIELTTT